MKICFIVGGNLVPTSVDDWREKHDSALIIENEQQSLRISLGMNRDEELSKKYEPYYCRVVSIEKLKQFRDGINDMIEKWNQT